MLLLLLLLAVPIGLMPPVRSLTSSPESKARISTMNPVVHSKQLVSRVILAAAGVAFIALLPFLPRREPDLCEAALLLFLGANLLAWAFSSRVAYSFTESWDLWGFAALGLALSWVSPSRAELDRVFLVMIGAAVLTAAYGLAIFFGFDPLTFGTGKSLFPFIYHKEEGRNFVHSFLGNPEYFGGYMAPLAVLAFSRMFRIGSGLVRRAAWFLLMLVFLFALLLSGTRGAFMGFALGSATVVLAQFRFLGSGSRRRLGLLLAAICVAGLAVVTVFSTPNRLNRRNMHLAQRFVQLFDLNSASVRERILFSAISGRMIAAHPVFGSGPGTYRLEFYPGAERLDQLDERAGVQAMIADLQSRVAEHAHNDYLEIWCETGTVGIASLLLLFSAAVIRFGSFGAGNMLRDETAAESARAREFRDLALFRTTFFAGAVCILFNAAFSFPLHLPVRASLLWVLVGAFAAADRLARRTGAALQEQ